MSSKMINCKTCGEEIASSAKVCPNCGGKVKKPIYKKWWFWAIIVILIFSVIAGSSGDDDSQSGAKTDTNTTSSQQNSGAKGNNASTEISYTSYDVTDLLDAVEANALKAQKDLKGQYIEIHGYLADIDSDGNYISVGAQKDNYDYLFRTIHCSIKSSNKDEITSKVIEMNTDQPIIVRGKVTDVGEILGIYLDIDSIE